MSQVIVYAMDDGWIARPAHVALRALGHALLQEGGPAAMAEAEAARRRTWQAERLL